MSSKRVMSCRAGCKCQGRTRSFLDWCPRTSGARLAASHTRSHPSAKVQMLLRAATQPATSTGSAELQASLIRLHGAAALASCPCGVCQHAAPCAGKAAARQVLSMHACMKMHAQGEMLVLGFCHTAPSDATDCRRMATQAGPPGSSCSRRPRSRRIGTLPGWLRHAPLLHDPGSLQQGHESGFRGSTSGYLLSAMPQRDQRISHLSCPAGVCSAAAQRAPLA